ncbi:MAG: amylo-alpha-1,6-glucosidase [bacterium]|nr:amylo-alpha-1,6-glucosidase [bacterium]
MSGYPVTYGKAGADASVQAGRMHQDGMQFYVMPDRGLSSGASYGNSRLWVATKGNGDIGSIFSNDIGRHVVSAVSIVPTVLSYRNVEYALGKADVYSRLRQDGDGSFTFHPVYQQHNFRLLLDLHVRDRIWLPLEACGDLPVCYREIYIANHSSQTAELRIFAYSQIRGETEPDMQGYYDENLGLLCCFNRSNPDNIRFTGFLERADAWETTSDMGRPGALIGFGGLSGHTTSCGNLLAALQKDIVVAPGSGVSLHLIIGFTSRGDRDLKGIAERSADLQNNFSASVSGLAEVAGHGVAHTPDRVINQGNFWCKVNMLRVTGDYPRGVGFSNDPGRSAKVVGRDLAWFTMGCDWLKPERSRRILEDFISYQYEDGKMPEYYDAVDGSREDYGLNINDVTPLVVVALGHHILATGDTAFACRVYPRVKAAVDYILSQTDDRGLVFCSAEGSDVWGICGWRNIIPGYTLSGAVTEINAECYGALQAAAFMAETAGKQQEAEDWREYALKLKEAAGRHLINKDNGLYYLNIDTMGHANADVTCDEVFPVIFGLASEEMAFNIISRLDKYDFWTEGGLRTLSRFSPDYRPGVNAGLTGGVWPGLSFWYAFAASRFQKESMVRALRNSYSLYIDNPCGRNTIPGQFSEWFDGENLINHGMRLSPWEPPRYLWAVVEGLFGIEGTVDGCRLDPMMPDDWRWMSIHRLPVRGELVTVFMSRIAGELYFHIRGKAESDYNSETYDEDISSLFQPLDIDAHLTAFRRTGEISVCIGSSSAEGIMAPVRISGVFAAETIYDLSIYDSRMGEWVDTAPRRGEELDRLTVELEPHGFRLLQFRAQL